MHVYLSTTTNAIQPAMTNNLSSNGASVVKYKLTAEGRVLAKGVLPKTAWLIDEPGGDFKWSIGHTKIQLPQARVLFTNYNNASSTDKAVNITVVKEGESICRVVFTGTFDEEIHGIRIKLWK